MTITDCFYSTRHATLTHNIDTDNDPDLDDPPMRLHAIVSGTVQGVGFRYFVRSAATNFGLTGWVRNLPGGQVEVLAEGDEDNLQELEQQLWKGPHFSRVEDVEVTYSGEPVAEFTTFEIRR